jgi:hypothetical protein
VACHHGNGPRGSKRSEYTTWIAHNDPHSRAYQVLFDEKSLIIEKKLKNLEDITRAKPHTNDLCLNCHVQPNVTKVSRAERYSLTDGVGCEACHGPAEKWLSTHYTEEWRRLTAKKKREQGMTNTKNVLVRAQVCVDCHVGREENDVNHVLIAAGHPRLHFEYGAYLAGYPGRHWSLDSDHRRYPDFEARAWLVGQAVSAQAAVDLLRYRAQEKPTEWPEFAEYGCFGCHHDLQGQKWRRKPTRGALPWGTWYFPLQSVVGASTRAARPEDLKAIEGLQEIMAKPFPNRKDVIRQAEHVSAVFNRWAEGLAGERAEEPDLRRLLSTLVENGPRLGDSGWDGAAQLCLGIEAAYHTLDDVNPAFHNDRVLKGRIRIMANHLSDAFRSGGGQYDSPRDFDPKQLRRDLGRLSLQLEEHRGR